MALAFNVLLHCLKCIVYTMMIVMLHTTDQQPKTTDEKMRNPNILIPFQMNRLSFSSPDKSTEANFTEQKMYLRCVQLVWNFFALVDVIRRRRWPTQKLFWCCCRADFYAIFAARCEAYTIFISNISLVLFRVNVRKTWHCYCTQHISSIDDRDDNTNNNNGHNVHKSILFSPSQPSL